MKNIQWTITSLKFLKRINNITSKETIIERTSTYNKDAILVNLYLIVNEPLEPMQPRQYMSRRNRTRRNNKSTPSELRVNMNINMDEAIKYPNSTRLGHDDTIPILTPRKKYTQ